MNKIKVICNYLFIIIESILLLSVILLFIFNMTVFDCDYIVNKLNYLNYYDDVYKDIKLEMSYYTGQSGFDDNILNDTFTKDEVKNQVEELIISYYNGRVMQIDLSDFEEKLNSKINAFLNDKNFNITNRDEVHQFVVEMSNIYKNKVKLIDLSDRIVNLFNKIIDITDILLCIFGVSIFILFFLNWFILKKKNLDIVFYITMFLLFFIYIFINSRLNISNLFLYNKSFSIFIVSVLKSVLKWIVLMGGVCFFAGIILSFFYVSFFIKKKTKQNN